MKKSVGIGVERTPRKPQLLKKVKWFKNEELSVEVQKIGKSQKEIGLKHENNTYLRDSEESQGFKRKLKWKSKEPVANFTDRDI